MKPISLRIMKPIFLWLATLLCLSTSAAETNNGVGTRAAAVGDEVMNFALPDAKGRLHELRRSDARAIVLYFTMNECPIARQSYAKLRALRKQFGEQGVAVWIINSDDSESSASVEKEARDHGAGSTPALRDDAQGVTRMLGVKRTCEAIAISTDRKAHV